MYKYINGNTHNFSFHTKGTHIHLILYLSILKLGNKFIRGRNHERTNVR